MQGTLQQISIVENKPTRIVLREIPRLDWIVMGALFAIALVLMVFGLVISGFIAVVVGIIIGLRSHVRYIILDTETDTLSITHNAVLRTHIVFQAELDHVLRIYLETDDVGYSQIMLVHGGEEFALSVYSLDGRAWKETIVIAINRWLQATREQDDT